MITLEQYRAAIGCFCPRQAMKRSEDHSHYYESCNCNRLTIEVVIVLLLMLCNFELSFLAVMKVVIAGDVETNPGPTVNVTKLVKASFHQGNGMFGDTAGMQCVCNALFSICWSKMKQLGCWQTADLDYILMKGDELYKSLDLLRYLSFDDLPRQLTVETVYSKINYVGNVTVEINRLNIDFLRRSLVQFKGQSNGIIFITNFVAFSLIWDSKAFFIFDSHSRDELGQHAENGTAILMKFSSLRQVQNFLVETYAPANGNAYCQMQYIAIETTSSKADIKKLQQRVLTRKRNNDHVEHQINLKKRRQTYANIKGTEAHKKLLHDLSEKYKSEKNKPKTMQVRIKKFKELIMEGPYYVCVVCNRCLYKRSVVLFKLEKYHTNDTEFYFARVQSFNGLEYICHTCDRKLKSKKQLTPCQAVCNKLEISFLPPNMSDINRLEKVLIAKRILFKKVVIMPKGNFPKIKGAICNVPMETEDVCNVLPRPACSNGLLLLKLKRKLVYVAMFFLNR